MKTIIFPNNELSSLDDLSESLMKISDDEIQIKISGGTYRGKLKLNSLDLKKIEFIGKDNVVFTGTNRNNIIFTKYNDNIIKGKIEKNLDFSMIKIDNDVLHTACYPNVTDNNLGTTIEELEKRAINWSKPTDGKIKALHLNEWGSNCYHINGYNKKLKLQWIGNNNRGSKYKNSTLIVSNIFEELDSKDEFYYDKESGEIFLYGYNENTYNIELFTNNNIVEIRDCNKTNITFDNITFAFTNSSMFNGNWERYLRSDWAFNTTSSFYIENSSNISISNCNFNNLGSNAIGIFNFAENILIDNCKITDCNSNGILALGNKNCTYCTSAWDDSRHITEMESNDKTGAKTNEYPRNIKIKNSYFYNLGLEDKQSAGICLSLCHKVSIENCTIHHLPRAGINICENAFGGHIISGCDIFDCVRETGDHGPFNSWGRDRFWSLKSFNTTGKFGDIKKKYVLADMLEKNIICNNRICGKSGFGIDLDDGSSYYHIYNNLCIGVGIKLREGFFRKVYSNVIIGAPIDLHTTFKGNDDEIFNNHIFNFLPLSVIILNKGYTTKIYNNTFYGSTNCFDNDKILKGQKNDFVDFDLSNINNTLEFSKKISQINFKFGAENMPEPNVSELNINFIKSEIIKVKNDIFCTIDETIRSATGCSDYDGLYVKKLGLFSKWRLFGIKKGDVITQVNGEKIMRKYKYIDKIKSAKIVRQQKIIEI